MTCKCPLSSTHCGRLCQLFLQTLARGWENAVNISARWLYGQWRCWEGVCFKLLPPLLSGFRKAVGQCQDLSFLPVLAGRPEGVANVLTCLRQSGRQEVLFNILSEIIYCFRVCVSLIYFYHCIGLHDFIYDFNLFLFLYDFFITMQNLF